MPDQQRRLAFDAAVEAYNRNHPEAPLHHMSARLLAVMFEHGDECVRSLESLAAEGFARHILPATLRSLIAAGLLERRPGTARTPDTYVLCLPEGVGR